MSPKKKAQVRCSVTRSPCSVLTWPVRVLLENPPWNISRSFKEATNRWVRTSEDLQCSKPTKNMSPKEQFWGRQMLRRSAGKASYQENDGYCPDLELSDSEAESDGNKEKSRVRKDSSDRENPSHDSRRDCRGKSKTHPLSHSSMQRWLATPKDNPTFAFVPSIGENPYIKSILVYMGRNFKEKNEIFPNKLAYSFWKDFKSSFYKHIRITNCPEAGLSRDYWEPLDPEYLLSFLVTVTH